MLDYLHHLFFPRESNNHRARILHIEPLFFLIILLSLMHFFTPVIERKYPDILGITANISVSDLVNLTNQKRIDAGLSPLSLDSQLSTAAMNKANDMLAKNYWAHNAPDGTTPWIFIKSAGYDYLYAGENLARGFTNASEAVDAWMASPGHKENILSPKYKDVGFAIVTGTLTGDETILIVQEFGDRINGTLNVGAAQTTINPTITSYPTNSPAPTFVAQLALPSATSVPTSIPTPTDTPTPTITQLLPRPSIPENSIFIAAINKKPVIDKQTMSKNIALLIGLFFILLFIIDILIIERKKIIRLVSHSTDHIIFLTIILLTVLLFSNGVII